MTDFEDRLKALMISPEFEYDELEAERIIKAHPDVVAMGMISGNYRATAMALEMKELEGWG